jgi:hypothetical protein
MENMTIGNQQVNLIAAKAWLAGMLDADGCISWTFSETKKGFKCYVPMTDVVSSCKATINALAKTYSFLEIPYCMYSPTKSRCTYYVRTAGVKRNLNLLPKIVPFLVTKQGEAKDMIEYCRSRLSHSDGRKPYTEKEKEILSRIKTAKAIRSLRDYDPDILWLKGEDIVRSHDESMS